MELDLDPTIVNRVKFSVNIHQNEPNDGLKLARIYEDLGRQHGKTTLLCDMVEENSVVVVHHTNQKRSIIDKISRRRPFFNTDSLNFVIVGSDITSFKKLKEEIVFQCRGKFLIASMRQVYIDNCVFDIITSRQMTKFYKDL